MNTENSDEAKSPIEIFRSPRLTLRGMYLWSDAVVSNHWRIQRRMDHDRWRLLDPQNRCVAAAKSLAPLRELMLQMQSEENSAAAEPPTQSGQSERSIVILLPGLLRTWRSMKLVQRRLQSSGHEVITMSYCSSRLAITDHSQALASVIEHLPVNARISFVAHSLGNIVVRHYAYLTQQRIIQPPSPRRFGRMVMLAPPNQGSTLARIFCRNPLFRGFTGDTGQQLGARWQEFCAQLTLPPCPFAIIAGRLPWRGRWTEFIGDMTVGVRETLLDGSSDYMEVVSHHGLIMRHPRALQGIENFIQYGDFGEARVRSGPADS